MVSIYRDTEAQTSASQARQDSSGSDESLSEGKREYQVIILGPAS